MKFPVIVYFLILCFGNLFAQKPYSIHLDKSNGLPCNEIYNLHQDQRGYFWIACDLGLFRYDGFEYRPYYTAGMSSKSGSYIREDGKGRIWYCTFDAKLYYVENDSLKAFENKTTLSQTIEFALTGTKLIALGRNNKLLFLDLYSGKLLKEIRLHEMYSSLYQFGNIFSLGNGHNVRFMDENGKELYSFFAEKGNYLFKVIPAEKKFYSLEFNEKVIEIYELSTSARQKIYSEPLTGNINGFNMIDSQLYILKKEGITQFDIRTRSGSRQLMPGISASHIIKDKNGFLWISSSFDGIYTFPSAASFMSFELPLINCKLRVIGDRFILFNALGEIYDFDLITLKFQRIYKDKSRSTIYDVVPFAHGEPDASLVNENFSLIPYGTYDLLVLKSGVKEVQQLDNKYLATAITGFAGILQYRNASASRWDSIATVYRDTVYAKNRKMSQSGFADNVRTKSVCYDSVTHTIYLATNLGIITATPSKISELFFQEKKIYAAKLSHWDGNIYLYLHSGDILTKQGEQIVMRNEKLNAFAPYQFFRQQDSLLFLGTSKELFYVNINNDQYTFKQIPFSMLISELNDIILYKDHFYLSVGRQLIRISKSDLASHRDISFYVNYIESNAARYYDVEEVMLGANEKDIRINFSALDFFQNSPAILYRINQEAWQKCGNGSRTILLSSLSPDEYRISFSVNGKLYPDIVHFTVRKPWYLSYLFIFSMIALLMLLSFFYYQRRLAASKKESALLLEKANLEKDLRQSMLSSIKSQMNPHFLFNALNTIQSYIITEDKLNASNYLTKFSKLTRKILEMSDRETISLQEEIDALILYIDLEKMRFPEINYTIEIDQELDTHHIMIPSMIIQPYVENAIKHGLLHKQGDKQLFIGIRTGMDHLFIKIEDNGIGRKCSAILQSNKHDQHRSFASAANTKRVELLNTDKNEIGVEYVDKVNESGESCGTSIHIKIPLKA